MLSNGVGIEETFNYILNLAQKANKILETKLEQFKSYCSLESMSTLLNRVEENEIAEEAARFLAQHKRNVSWTAAMHIFL